MHNASVSAENKYSESPGSREFPHYENRGPGFIKRLVTTAAVLLTERVMETGVRWEEAGTAAVEVTLCVESTAKPVDLKTKRTK